MARRNIDYETPILLSLSLYLSPPTPKHNGVNNTAERDLALQKERLAFLVHHVDWRDQFTFVLSLASPPPQAYFRAVWQAVKFTRLP